MYYNLFEKILIKPFLKYEIIVIIIIALFAVYEIYELIILKTLNQTWRIKIEKENLDLELGVYRVFSWVVFLTYNSGFLLFNAQNTPSESLIQVGMNAQKSYSF